MTGTALIRPPSAVAWELRGAWATGRRVSLTLDERCEIPRLEGCVLHVSGTGATCNVAGWHVPIDAVLAVHRPTRLGDSTWEDGEPWHGRARAPQQMAGQMELR